MPDCTVDDVARNAMSAHLVGQELNQEIPQTNWISALTICCLTNRFALFTVVLRNSSSFSLPIDRGERSVKRGLL